MERSKEKLIQDNEKLVPFTIQRFGISSGKYEYEDVISIGNIGLINAATTFDESKGTTFATYAIRCIQNEIYKFFYKDSKRINSISLEQPISENLDGEFTIEDTIADPNSDFTEKYEDNEEFLKVFSVILNCLSLNEKVIMLYRMCNKNYKKISKQLKINKTHIPAIEKKAVRVIRELIKREKTYKKIFNISKSYNTYRISFLTTDIPNYNSKVTTFFKILSCEFDEDELKIIYNEEKVIIELPIEEKSFSMLAYIIQEINKRCKKIRYQNQVGGKI